MKHDDTCFFFVTVFSYKSPVIRSKEDSKYKYYRKRNEEPVAPVHYQVLAVLHQAQV